MSGNLPVRVGVQRGHRRLIGLHAIDVGLVDIDLDLEGVHVDDGAHTGAREAAGRQGRDDLADLGRLRGDDAGERRVHGRVVDIDLCALHVGFGDLDLLHLRSDLRGQRGDLRARGLYSLDRDQMSVHQVLVASQVAFRLRELRLVLHQGRLGARPARLGLQQSSPVLSVIDPCEHLPLGHVLTLFDEYLSERAGDLRGHRRLNARGDITRRLQNGGCAGIRRGGHGGRLIHFELRCAQEEVISGRPRRSQQQQSHDDADDQARATRIALGVLLTLTALDAQLLQQLFLLFDQ